MFSILSYKKENARRKGVCFQSPTTLLSTKQFYYVMISSLLYVWIVVYELQFLVKKRENL